MAPIWIAVHLVFGSSTGHFPGEFWITALIERWRQENLIPSQALCYRPHLSPYEAAYAVYALFDRFDKDTKYIELSLPILDTPTQKRLEVLRAYKFDVKAIRVLTVWLRPSMEAM